MHQYDLMRLLVHVTKLLAEYARTPETAELAAQTAAMAAEWNAEEREYIDAITRSDD